MRLKWGMAPFHSGLAYPKSFLTDHSTLLTPTCLPHCFLLLDEREERTAQIRFSLLTLTLLSQGACIL